MSTNPSAVDQRWHNAVRYAEQAVQNAKDWQEVQHALAEHPVHGPWIRSIAMDDMDCAKIAQEVISEAEEKLGDRVPY